MELDINPHWESEEQELVDMLIAISMVSRHLARKIQHKQPREEEKDHEQDERPCYNLHIYFVIFYMNLNTT